MTSASDSHEHKSSLRLSRASDNSIRARANASDDQLHHVRHAGGGDAEDGRAKLEEVLVPFPPCGLERAECQKEDIIVAEEWARLESVCDLPSGMAVAVIDQSKDTKMIPSTRASTMKACSVPEGNWSGYTSSRPGFCCLTSSALVGFSPDCFSPVIHLNAMQR